jgi:hypothetical protein
MPGRSYEARWPSFFNFHELGKMCDVYSGSKAYDGKYKGERHPSCPTAFLAVDSLKIMTTPSPTLESLQTTSGQSWGGYVREHSRVDAENFESVSEKIAVSMSCYREKNQEKVIRTAPQLALRWKLPKIRLMVKRYDKILEIVGESLLFLTRCERKERE